MSAVSCATRAAGPSIAGQSVQRTDRTSEALPLAPCPLSKSAGAKCLLPPRPTKNAAEHAPDDLAAHLAPDRAGGAFDQLLAHTGAGATGAAAQKVAQAVQQTAFGCGGGGLLVSGCWGPAATGCSRWQAWRLGGRGAKAGLHMALERLKR